MTDQKDAAENSVATMPENNPPLESALGYFGAAICSGMSAWHAFHMESAFGWGIAAMVCLLIAHLAKPDKRAEMTPQPDDADATAVVGVDDSRQEEAIAGGNVPDVVQLEPLKPVAEPGRFVRGFAKFLRGDFGLAKTFWLFGTLGSIVWGLLTYALIFTTRSEMVAIACAYFSFFFLLFVSGATWDAATKYEGNPVWAILAKIYVVLSVLGYFVNLYLAF